MRASINDEGFAEQMAKDIRINFTDLDSEFIKQAALFSFYAEQLRVTQVAADKAKLLRDMAYASEDKRIRDESVGKKITEKQTENEVLLSKKYQRAALAYNEARAKTELIRNYLEALTQKRDSLVQLAKAKNEDMKGKMSHKH
jgi:hypothetical protein